MHRFWCIRVCSLAFSQMGASRNRKSSSLFEPGYDRMVKALVELRDHAHLTQQQLADRLGRHRSFIWKTEGGQRRLDLIEFVKWCRACGADPDEVFHPLAASVPKGR